MRIFEQIFIYVNVSILEIAKNEIDVAISDAPG